MIEVADIDPLAQKICALNAKANHVLLDKNLHDVVGQPCSWDIIFCGDVCYEASMTHHLAEVKVMRTVRGSRIYC